ISDALRAVQRTLVTELNDAHFCAEIEAVFHLWWTWREPFVGWWLKRFFTVPMIQRNRFARYFTIPVLEERRSGGKHWIALHKETLGWHGNNPVGVRIDRWINNVVVADVGAHEQGTNCISTTGEGVGQSIGAIENGGNGLCIIQAR